jgi:hypothetical protein
MTKAKNNSELNPNPEQDNLGVAVLEAKEELLESEATLDQMNELRSTINDINESLANVSSMIGDHEVRLMHLGAEAKPIPKSVYGTIDLGNLFGQIVSQSVAGFLQQFPHSKDNVESVRSYARTAILAGTLVLEEIIKRKEDSHRT